MRLVPPFLRWPLLGLWSGVLPIVSESAIVRPRLVRSVSSGRRSFCRLQAFASAMAWRSDSVMDDEVCFAGPGGGQAAGDGWGERRWNVLLRRSGTVHGWAAGWATVMLRTLSGANG